MMRVLQLFNLLALMSLPHEALGFTTSSQVAFTRTSVPLKAAESEVNFGDLDGTNVRIGIIRTRWNKEPVDALVDGAKRALKECNVSDTNIFVTEVAGSFELPLAAKYLALSGTVDAIVCAGVLIKGETYHFEYIADTVAKGLMNVGIATNIPVIFGVLTCLTEAQVTARTTGDNNHGYDHGKTAVEMALLRAEATGMASPKPSANLQSMGFGKKGEASEEKKEKQYF